MKKIISYIKSFFKNVKKRKKLKDKLHRIKRNDPFIYK